MEILNAYSVISRSRLYAGMAGVPLPISLHDIECYLSSRKISLERDEFDTAIFALDDLWLDTWTKRQEMLTKNK